MKREIKVELFGEASNIAVIRMPQRRYPGILIQGDSFSDLLGSAKDALENLSSNNKESYEAIAYLYEELQWRFTFYEKAIEELLS